MRLFQWSNRITSSLRGAGRIRLRVSKIVL